MNTDLTESNHLSQMVTYRTILAHDLRDVIKSAYIYSWEVTAKFRYPPSDSVSSYAGRLEFL